MASLGWVTPEAATEGVTPLFFFFSLKNLNRQFCGVTPDDLFDDVFFAHRFIAFYCFHSDVSGVTPLEGVTLHLFYLSDLVSPLFFVNLSTKFFSFGCHPLEGVTLGGPPPRPPSDATERITVAHRTSVLASWIIL